MVAARVRSTKPSTNTLKKMKNWKQYMTPLDVMRTVTPCLYCDVSSHLEQSGTRYVHSSYLSWRAGGGGAFGAVTRVCGRSLYTRPRAAHVSAPISPLGRRFQVVEPPTELKAPVCTIAFTLAWTVFRLISARPLALALVYLVGKGCVGG